MASERKDKDTLSNDTFDLRCTVCKGKGKNTEAETYCVQCSDYYCLTCVKVHEDVPLLTGHKILDKGQFPLVSHQQFLPVSTELCDRHSHNRVDMYCQNHDDVGCSTCMTKEHRLCKDIFYIPEFIQNNRSMPASRDIQLKLDSAAKSLTEQLDYFQHEKERLFEIKAESLEEIRKFREEINAKLDQLEQKSVAEIEEKFKTLITEIEGNVDKLQGDKSSVSSAKDKLAAASNNVFQDFVNAKKGRNIARDARKSIEKSKSCFHRKDIDLTCDQKIQSLLKEMNVLGEVMLRDALLLTKGKTTNNVSIASDKETCDIVSVCVLEDGTIILSDYSNKKLKRLHRSAYIVTCFLDLPGKPLEVCSIDNQQVAVSLQSLADIHFVSVGSKMTKIKQIKLDFVCYGLAYANDKLFISDSETAVYICRLFGKKLKQFTTDQLGQRLFSNINSIAVSEDGSKIYVTGLNNGLIILDNNGKLIGTFNGAQLKSPVSCYLTSNGSVIVAGWGSNNVLQFGPSGKLIGEVLKPDGGSTGCQAIACDQHMSKMIVGYARTYSSYPSSYKTTSLPVSKDIQQNLESAAKSLTEQLDHFQQETQRLLKMKAESLEEVRKFREEINARLDQMEQKSVAEIEEKFKTLITEIEGSMGMIQTNMARVGPAKDKLASATNNVSQEFVNATKGRNAARDARKSIEKSNSCYQEKNISFTRDQNIQSLLKEMNMLGEVLLSDALLRTKGKKTYNVNVESDKDDCNIVSVCVLEDGTIILSDQSNMRLKRLHWSKCTVTDLLDLSHQPWQVCPIDNQQVAVSLQSLKEIHLISVGSKMTKLKQIKLDFDCYGLTYTTDKLFILDSETAVYICSVSGKMLKQFTTDQLGQRLFCNIRSIAVSEDSSKIYVTDLANGLIILDDNGQLIGKFNGPELKYPHSCYLTSKGSVIVAGICSYNVLQFGPSGKLIGKVLMSDGGNKGYQAVACDLQMSKMIVGSFRDNIKVYDIL